MYLKQLKGAVIESKGARINACVFRLKAMYKVSDGSNGKRFSDYCSKFSFVFSNVNHMLYCIKHEHKSIWFCLLFCAHP